MARHWERPNWKNLEEYPVPVTMYLHQWYWQFLRRRTDYVSDYWKYADETYESDCKVYTENKKLGVEIDDIFTPDHEDFRSGVPNAYYKYKTLVCPNPINDRPSGFHYTADKTISMITGSDRDSRTGLELLPHQAAIIFNFQMPIAQQIEGAQAMLVGWQKYYMSKTEGRSEAVQFRRHISKWPNYLRALDASDKGETLEEIGLVLSSPCLSDEGLEEHLFTVGSEKLKRIGQSTVSAAREVQINFPF